MKKILVDTDFSEHADYAVKSAASLAKQTGAQLILLHVINRHLDSEDDSNKGCYDMLVSNRIESRVQKKLNAIIKKYKLNEAKVFYEFRYDEFKAILKHADRHEVDLIVMGAYGSTGSEGTFIDPNTKRVMLQTKTPVMIVKEKFKLIL